jgi:hypothetical protein
LHGCDYQYLTIAQGEQRMLQTTRKDSVGSNRSSLDFFFDLAAQPVEVAVDHGIVEDIGLEPFALIEHLRLVGQADN